MQFEEYRFLYSVVGALFESSFSEVVLEWFCDMFKH